LRKIFETQHWWSCCVVVTVPLAPHPSRHLHVSAPSLHHSNAVSTYARYGAGAVSTSSVTPPHLSCHTIRHAGISVFNSAPSPHLNDGRTAPRRRPSWYCCCCCCCCGCCGCGCCCAAVASLLTYRCCCCCCCSCSCPRSVLLLLLLLCLLYNFRTLLLRP